MDQEAAAASIMLMSVHAAQPAVHQLTGTKKMFSRSSPF